MYQKAYATFASASTSSQGQVTTSIRKAWAPSGTEWNRVGGSFLK